MMHDADEPSDLFGSADIAEPSSRRRASLATPTPCGIPTGETTPRGLSLGTCAWQHESYRSWVYPPGLSPRLELAYYARFCNAVEVDGSFYRVPTPDTVQRWCDEAGPGFRFTMKAPRSATHAPVPGLFTREAAADWDALVRAAQAFGPALGAILIQLSPWAKLTSPAVHGLRSLLEALPHELPVAVEFRHASWNVPETQALLRDYQATRAWCDHYLDPQREMAPDDPTLAPDVGAFRYIRLLGDMSTKYDPVTGARRFKYGRILFDRQSDLALWIMRIQNLLNNGIPTLVFINNHYEGFALQTARNIRQALTSPR